MPVTDHPVWFTLYVLLNICVFGTAPLVDHQVIEPLSSAIASQVRSVAKPFTLPELSPAIDPRASVTVAPVKTHFDCFWSKSEASSRPITVIFVLKPVTAVRITFPVLSV